MIVQLTSGVAVGVNGAATANKTSTNPITGFVHAVHIDYQDAPPATTDVTIATSGSRAPAQTILLQANANTDKWYYPRILEQLNTDGTDLATHAMIAIDDFVKVTIAEANANDYVNVYLLVEPV